MSKDYHPIPRLSRPCGKPADLMVGEIDPEAGPVTDTHGPSLAPAIQRSRNGSATTLA
jgi:hypothetical protein